MINCLFLVIGFQILRAAIHNEKVKVPEEKRRNERSYEVQLEKVRRAQNALVSLDAVAIVLPHLSVPGSDVPREVLAFLVALLDGGNPVVQGAFMDFFTKTKAETFFLCVKARMEMSATAMKERRTLISQQKSRKSYQKRYLRSLMTKDSLMTHSNDETSEAGEGLPPFIFRSHLRSYIRSVRNAGRIISRRSSSRTTSAEMEPLTSEVPGVRVIVHGHEVASSGPEDENVLAQALANPRAMQSVIGTDDSEEADGFLEYKDAGYAHIVLKLLAQLCDGQNSHTQNYLREQKDNVKSINVVAETARLLQHLYSGICKENIGLTTQLFDTLIEISQGNGANQMTIINHKLIDYVNFILRKDQFPDCDDREIFGLKRSIGLLLKIMTEENSASGHAKVIAESLSKDEVFKAVQDSHGKVLTMSDSKAKDLVSTVGFIFFHVLRRVMDMTEMSAENTQWMASETWRFFGGSTLSVEILKGDQLQKVYFHVKDRNIIRKDVKERLKWEVNRSTPSKKHQSFMEWSKNIRNDIKYQQKVNSFALSRILVSAWQPLNTALLILSFLINIMILSYWAAPEKYDPTNFSTAYWTHAKTFPPLDASIFILGVIHNFLSFMLLGSYFLSNKPRLPKIFDRFETIFFKKLQCISFKCFKIWDNNLFLGNVRAMLTT